MKNINYHITSSTNLKYGKFSGFQHVNPSTEKNVTVKEWRGLFECAVAGLANDKARIAYIPFTVQCSSADTKLALEATKKITLKEELDELEARIDG